MEMIDTGVVLAGAALGGAAGYFATEDQDIAVKAGATIVGAAVGAAVAKFGHSFIKENNPIVDLIR